MQHYNNLKMFLRTIWKDILHLIRTPQLDRGIVDLFRKTLEEALLGVNWNRFVELRKLSNGHNVYDGK